MTTFTQAIQQSDPDDVNFWIQSKIDVNLPLKLHSLITSRIESNAAPLTYAIDIFLSRIEKIASCKEPATTEDIDKTNHAKDVIGLLIAANANVDTDVRVQMKPSQQNTYSHDKIQTSYIAWLFSELPQQEKKYKTHSRQQCLDIFFDNFRTPKLNTGLIVKMIKSVIDILLTKVQHWDDISPILDKGYVELTLLWLERNKCITEKQRYSLQILIAHYDAMEVFDKLKKRNIILNEVDPRTGDNLAHLACSTRHTVLIKRLLTDDIYRPLFNRTNNNNNLPGDNYILTENLDPDIILALPLTPQKCMYLWRSLAIENKPSNDPILHILINKLSDFRTTFDNSGLTLLHLAPNVHWIEIFLQKGVDPNIKGSRNISPLENIFCTYWQIPLQQKLNNANALIAAGAILTETVVKSVLDIFLRENIDSQTLILNWLESHRLSVTRLDSNGETLLHRVVTSCFSQSWVDLLSLLHKKGGNWDDKNNSGLTPLDSLIKRFSERVHNSKLDYDLAHYLHTLFLSAVPASLNNSHCKMLISLASQSGYQPLLQWLLEETTLLTPGDKQQAWGKALVVASTENHSELIQWLFEYIFRIDANNQASDYSSNLCKALQAASEKNHVAIIEQLIEQHAIDYITNEQINILTQHCIKHFNVSFAKQLTQKINKDFVNADGQTYLHLLVMDYLKKLMHKEDQISIESFVELWQLFVTVGVDVTKSDISQLSAFHYMFCFHQFKKSQSENFQYYSRTAVAIGSYFWPWIKYAIRQKYMILTRETTLICLNIALLYEDKDILVFLHEQPAITSTDYQDALTKFCLDKISVLFEKLGQCDRILQKLDFLKRINFLYNKSVDSSKFNISNKHFGLKSYSLSWPLILLENFNNEDSHDKSAIQKIIIYFIDAGAITTERTKEGWPLFHMALQKGCHTVAKYLLENKAINVEQSVTVSYNASFSNMHGISPIMIVIMKDDVVGFQMLLPKLTSKTVNEYPLLFLLCRHKSLQILKYYLEFHNPDINQKITVREINLLFNLLGNTIYERKEVFILDMIFDNHNPQKITNVASQQEKILKLLLDHGLLLNINLIFQIIKKGYLFSDDFWLQLMIKTYDTLGVAEMITHEILALTCYSNNTPAFKAIINLPDARRLIDAKNKQQQSVLVAAAIRYDANCNAKDRSTINYYKTLCEKGASEVQVDINGYTPLHYALFNDCVTLLNNKWPFEIDKTSFYQLRFSLEQKLIASDHTFMFMPREIYQLNSVIYKMLLWMKSSQQVSAFINTHCEPFTAEQVWTLNLLNLPLTGKWTPQKWASLAQEWGIRTFKYLKIAPYIESKLGSAALTQNNIKHVAKMYTYPKVHIQDELSAVLAQSFIDYSDYLLVLEKYQKKSSDMLPDMTIDGNVLISNLTKDSKTYNEHKEKTLTLSHYEIKKLPKDDYRGFVLGTSTGCCQSIGSAGHECAWHGMTSDYGGFYVVINKTIHKKYLNKKKVYDIAMQAVDIVSFLNSLTNKSQRHTYREYINLLNSEHYSNIGDDLNINQLRAELYRDVIQLKLREIVAQSWVWISDDNSLVFDSWECIRKDLQQLCLPFIKCVANKVLSNKKLSPKIERVLLGCGGNTPKLALVKNQLPVYPRDTALYPDALNQYIVMTKRELKPTQDNRDHLNQAEEIAPTFC